MRPIYLFAGLIALGLGVAGWAALGVAQTGPSLSPAVPDVKPPTAVPDARPGHRPGTQPRTPDEPVADPLPPLPMPLPAERPTKPRTDGRSEPEPANVKAPEVRPPTFATDPKPAVVIPAAARESDPKPPAELAAAARQDPSVSLEWFGPTAIKAGAPAEYTLRARNTSPIPLHKVIVQVRVPVGAKVDEADPKPAGTDGVLLWDLGMLPPKDERAIRMKFMPSGKGDLACQAWVTFTGSSALKVQVREPKLAVKVEVPEKVAVGDAANVVLAVSNPGDHPADAVTLAVSLGEGLESAKGAKAVFELNSLAAGETRQVTIPCVARAAGAQKCEAAAEGTDGLKAADAGTVTVSQPRLDLEICGPKTRYLDRKAVYTFKVTNPGDAPAGSVVVTDVVPAGFKFVAADSEGHYDTAAKVVKWAIGEVGPGETKEVKCELLAIGAGDFTHKAAVASARGLRVEKDWTTRLEGLSALSMEVIDTEDPVEVGRDTSYEIRITNTGSKDEADVKLVCAIPPQMKFKSATGPGKFDVVAGEVVFETVKALPARADVTFKITVTAALKGDARFKATLTAGGLTEPVIKQESTRVYDD
jgi:uncharacterized repeat protein (TIGR01451 family)